MKKDVFYVHGIEAEIQFPLLPKSLIKSKWGTKIQQTKGSNSFLLPLPVASVLRGYSVKWQDVSLNFDVNKYATIDNISIIQFRNKSNDSFDIDVWSKSNEQSITSMNTGIKFNIKDHYCTGRAIMKIDVSFIDSKEGLGEITILGAGVILEAQDTILNDALDIARDITDFANKFNPLS